MSRIQLVATAALAATLSLPSTASAQLATSSAQYWVQSSAGLSFGAQGDAYMGTALAAGDFNGDGFDELAFGIPEFDSEGLFDVGRTLVLPGSADGPTALSYDFWSQDSAALLDGGEQDDQFGRTLAVGDFNGDGYEDLAVGIPYETVELEDPVPAAGAVQVLYGGESGLGPVGNQFLHQGVDAGAIIGAPEEYDRFGSSLAVGDFDADGYDDLVVGVPYESVGATPNAGAFHVLFGSAFGITPVNDRIFYLGNGMPGAPASGEFLAWSLATGDFDPGSVGDELAVGAPGTMVSGRIYAGAVWIVRNLDGSAFSSVLHLDVDGMPGESEAQDQFGCTLASGQFDGAAGDDLAVTACYRAAGEVDEAGVVFVTYFDERPTAVIDQDDLTGLEAEAETGDFFGLGLTVGDFDADGVDDLVIGVPFEELDGAAAVGIAHVLRGIDGYGLYVNSGTTIRQAESPEEQDDHFAGAMVAGRFSGRSGTDLAIAAPWESYAGNDRAGAVHVFFSDALFVDGFESGGAGAWSVAVP